MLHVTTKAELRDACDRARARGRTVGLVPTMGFLHTGHRSLMRAARRATDFVVVTIFVNPLQFGPGEDLDRYPRDLSGDLEQCAAEGVDVVFAPTTTEMYPRPTQTTVHVAGLTAAMCGASRPVHFDGVTTVLAKLFSITGPCRAFFGRKDAQQLAVVRRMATDLDFPVEVVGCALVREPDGLARSSRNAYLDAEERAAAPVLFRALSAAAEAARAGERDTGALCGIVRATVATQPRVQLEYVEARDAHEITPVGELAGDVLLAVAAHVGSTRLIDNIVMSVAGDGVEIDLGITEQPSERKGA